MRDALQILIYEQQNDPDDDDDDLFRIVYGYKGA